MSERAARPAGARGRGVTWLWLALLALGLAAIAWQALRPADAPERAADDAAAVPLVTAPESAWSAVELLGTEGLTRFERDATGRWLLHGDSAGESGGEAAGHEHRADPVAAERIAGVFGAFSRTGIERRLGAVDAERLAAYGLDRPALIVMVRDADGRPLLTLEAGQVAPDGLSRYVRLPRDGSVLTVPNYQIEGLLALTRAVPAPAASAVAR